ncbi:ribosome biogenesis factor YjgA [Microbulbifer sp. 2201CG32-9]|uniref:ribosome biogenesis factor YjgA n=1 Tax=unclassified Microbulbifer TaxID=2619833 RepID=UPI00345B57C9
MEQPDDFSDSGDELPKSKTQVKQEMHALQELGRRLSKLSPAQLDTIPLENDLREALDTLHRIKSNEARRRQLQYIGKLMRRVDSEAIEVALNQFRERDQQHLRVDRLAEEWRRQLLEGGKDAQKKFFDRFPQADHQHLRQLVRDAKREIQHNRPPANQRKLFRYLRDLLASL